MICNVCEGVLERHEGFEEQRDGRRYYFHHPDGRSLEEAAILGCCICLPFWEAFSIRERNQLRNVQKFTTSSEANSTRPLSITRARLMHSQKVRNCYALGIRLNVSWSLTLRHSDFSRWNTLTTSTLVPAEQVGPGNVGCLTSCNTSSEESWNTALKWIETCTLNHTTCQNARPSDGWLPTRLLDLGSPETMKTDIHIVYTEEEDVQGPYVTLSHCWGSAQVVQLTRATTPRFRNGFPLHELPKTFQDAVAITRRLGIRYIWIDSLCILQDKDDLTDWLQEAAVMSKVYTYTFCNISAAAAVDGSKGLFFDRDPLQQNPTRIRLLTSGLSLDESSVDCYIIDEYFWRHKVTQCPLNKRAWVMQERWLAPRVLHFGQGQLFWECCELDACEAHPKAWPPDPNLTAFAKFKTRDMRGLEAKSDAVQSTSHQSDFAYERLWLTLLSTYTETKLTKSSDRLVAISGIAKYMSKLRNDEYVAGMWRRCLASELMWSSILPCVRPEKYQAPSFSWAAVEGDISHAQLVEDNVFIKVEQIHLDYVTNDPTGMLKGGFIRVIGMLRQLKFVEYAGRSGNDPGEVFPRWQMIVTGTTAGHYLVGTHEALRVSFDVDDIDFAVENEAGTLHYLIVRQYRDRCEYLLLILTDRDAGVFRRIGMMFTDVAETIKRLERSPENDLNLPGGKDKDGFHTTTIV